MNAGVPTQMRDLVYGADAAGGPHAQALQLMQQSPLTDALAPLQSIRDALLADNPKALRKQVGWFGRLIGNDVALAAKAKTLRERLGILLFDAQQHSERLQIYIAQLEHAQIQLHDAVDILDAAQSQSSVQDANTGPQSVGTMGPQKHMHYASIAATYRITQGQLQVLAANAQNLHERYAWLLPRLRELLLQERGLQAGATQSHALSQAVALIDDLQDSTSAAIEKDSPTASIHRTTP